MDQKTQRSRAFPPTLCHGVTRIFLTAPLSYDTVALQRGQCEQLLRYVKLATSSRRGAASRIGGYERDSYQKPPPGAMPVTPGASRRSKLHRSPQKGKGWRTSIGVQWHAAAPRAEPCTAFVACMENMSGMPSRAPASHRVL